MRCGGTATRQAYPWWLTLSIAAAVWSLFAMLARPAAVVAQKAQNPKPHVPPGTRLFADLVYAQVNGRELKLDLYLPTQAKAPLPVVVWIHGGGWRAGTKANPRLIVWIVPRGYAVASIEYRLTGEASFPAQIHDCKGAVRWLRAHAAEHNLDPNRFAAAGASAGGHLALLLGTSAGVEQLEGSVGGNLDQSSKVQAVVDFYGPTDFIDWLNSPDGERISRPDSPVARLLGGPPRTRLDLARLASPVYHVSPDDPPVLMIHGSADPVVPLRQSLRLAERYRELGLTAQLQVLEGARHGGPEFHAPQVRRVVADFLRDHLRTGDG